MVCAQFFRLSWPDVDGYSRSLYFGATDALLPPGRFLHVFMGGRFGCVLHMAHLLKDRTASYIARSRNR